MGHSTVTAGHLLTHSQPAAGHEQAVEDALAPLSTPPPPAQSLYSSADPDWKVPGCGSRGDEMGAPQIGRVPRLLIGRGSQFSTPTANQPETERR